MSKSKSRLPYWIKWILCGVGVIIIGVPLLARKPDFELSFQRRVETNATPAHVDAAWSDITQWPRWFHSLKSAQILGDEPSKVAVGKEVVLEIDPRKGPFRRFTLRARISEYVPGRKIGFRVTYDSKDRLTRLFDRVDWTVEISPIEGRTAADQRRYSLLGEGRAHTNHWRSRFFGRVVDQILIHQIFYPDLFKLAKITEPADQSLPPLH